MSGRKRLDDTISLCVRDPEGKVAKLVKEAKERNEPVVMRKPLSSEEALERVRVAAEEGTITMASSDAIEHYQAEADEICDVLERLLDIKVAFLSDVSSFGDFCRAGEESTSYYARLSDALGVSVEPGDSIIEVCRRLRQQSRAGRS